VGDFFSLNDRWIESTTLWDYREKVLSRLRQSDSLLDLETGGGEFLSHETTSQSQFRFSTQL
jgi:hypothetical protein